MAGLADQDATLPADDLLRLGEDDLQLAGILAGFLGHRERSLTGGHVRKPHDATFALGDDLLRDDENVAVLKPLVRARERVEEQAHEVVARTDLRQTVDRDDR